MKIAAKIDGTVLVAIFNSMLRTEDNANERRIL